MSHNVRPPEPPALPPPPCREEVGRLLPEGSLPQLRPLTQLPCQPLHVSLERIANLLQNHLPPEPQQNATGPEGRIVPPGGHTRGCLIRSVSAPSLAWPPEANWRPSLPDNPSAPAVPLIVTSACSPEAVLTPSALAAIAENPVGDLVPAAPVQPLSVSPPPQRADARAATFPNSFGLHCPAVFQRTVAQCLATAHSLLIPVSTLGELMVLAHTDGETLLCASQDSANSAVSSEERKAERLLAQVLHAHTCIVFPAGWVDNRQVKVLVSPVPIALPPLAVVRTQQQRRWRQAHQPGLYFMMLTALLGGASYEAAATAYARAAAFRQTVASATEATLAGQIMMQAVSLRFGARELTSVARGQDPSQCEVATLPELTIKSLLAESQLRDALYSFSNPDDVSETEFIHEWGAAIQAFDPTDIPEGACKELPTLQQRSLMDVPFSHPTPIPVTSWIPRKPQQVCQTCPNASHCSQLILPEARCAGAIAEWWEHASYDFAALAAGRGLDARRTQTLAIGQDCFLPCAQGCVWDCRVPHVVSPLDYSAPVDQDVALSLDRDALVEAMADWPDQGLRSHLHYGVRFGADLPLQLVLTPQLKSLAFAFDKTQLELRELADRGWYALFDYLPFMPSRMHPKGATARKLENRPRPTTDGSHPHSSRPVLDTAGIPVVSINEAIQTGCYGPKPPASSQPLLRQMTRTSPHGGGHTLLGSMWRSVFLRNTSRPWRRSLGMRPSSPFRRAATHLFPLSQSSSSSTTSATISPRSQCPLKTCGKRWWPATLRPI